MKSIVVFTRQTELFAELDNLLETYRITSSIHRYSDPYALLSDLEGIQCDILLLDLGSSKLSDLELLPRMRKLRPELPLIILAKDKRYAMEALRYEALDYIIPPVTAERITEIIFYLQHPAREGITHTSHAQ